MARRSDTSLKTFFKENPEYNISRMLEKIPKTEDVPLREGAPSSLAAVRRPIPGHVRIEMAMKESEDAYRKWKARRMGALRYRSTPSVSDHLGDVQRQYESDSIAQERNQAVEDYKAKLDEMTSFEESGYSQDYEGYFDAVMDNVAAPTLKELIDKERGGRDTVYPQFSEHGKEEGLFTTFLATESSVNPEETKRLQEALGYSQPSNVTQTDLGGGNVEIEIDNDDPDKRIRFIYDTKDDILKTYEF